MKLETEGWQIPSVLPYKLSHNISICLHTCTLFTLTMLIGFSSIIYIYIWFHRSILVFNACYAQMSCNIPWCLKGIHIYVPYWLVHIHTLGTPTKLSGNKTIQATAKYTAIPFAMYSDGNNFIAVMFWTDAYNVIDTVLGPKIAPLWSVS